jgi:parallel beta-helix repeat protein
MRQSLALLIACLLVSRVYSASTTIYVSPAGDDRWSGNVLAANNDRTDGPLATLPAALEKSRELREREKIVAPEIILCGGVYVLTRPLAFTPEDSDLVIAARPGEKAVISGETQITGWRYSSVNPNIWEARIPGGANGAWQFHELFVNGRRKQRSRVPFTGFFCAAGGRIDSHPVELRVHPGDIKPEWAASGDVELIAYSAWAQTRNQIRKLSESSNLVTLAGDALANEMETNSRYYIENAPDALRPGEWHLDSTTGTVSYWPKAGEDVPSARITAPRLYELVQIEGQPNNPVQGIVFRGLTFADTDWSLERGSDVDGQAAVEIGAAFKAEFARNCALQRCVFTRLGGYAVDFGHGSISNRVSHCEMFDLGAGGVRVGDPAIDQAKSAPAFGNTIDNNHIHHFGLVSAPAVGVIIFLSPSNVVAHNEIDHSFYTAISCGWTWGYRDTPCRGNIIEFNHLHDIGQGMLSDMGGVYTLGLQPGTIVRNNLIHDVNIFQYGGWGLYTDEGSSDIVLESNVVYKCQSAGFHQHYGSNNLVYNNIFALNKESQLQRTRPETHLGFILTNNIIYFEAGEVFSGNWSGNGFIIDHNIFYSPRFESSKPSFTAPHVDDALFADPQFVSPEKGNFQLRLGSPAFKFGFHPPDLRNVGPQK